MNTTAKRLGLVRPLAGPPFAARLWTAVPVALAAAVVNQVLHEGTHVIVALAVGDVARVQLFAVDTIAEGRTAQLLVAGSAAIVNIVAAAVGAPVTPLPSSKRPALAIGAAGAAVALAFDTGLAALVGNALSGERATHDADGAVEVSWRRPDRMPPTRLTTPRMIRRIPPIVVNSSRLWPG